MFTLGFLPSVSPVQSLFHEKSWHILSYLFLSFLFFFLSAIQFLSGKKTWRRKEEIRSVMREGKMEGRKEGRKEARQQYEKGLPLHHPEHFSTEE